MILRANTRGRRMQVDNTAITGTAQHGSERRVALGGGGSGHGVEEGWREGREAALSELQVEFGVGDLHLLLLGG